jgi:hypothetical protein
LLQIVGEKSLKIGAKSVLAAAWRDPNGIGLYEMLPGARRRRS